MPSQKDSPPGQVFHPDIERSEIIGKGWQGGAQRQPAGVVESKKYQLIFK